MKEKVTLKFSSLQNLWAFKSEVETLRCEINPANLTLTCECTKEHIELAIKKYDAIVVIAKQQMA